MEWFLDYQFHQHKSVDILLWIEEAGITVLSGYVTVVAIQGLPGRSPRGLLQLAAGWNATCFHAYTWDGISCKNIFFWFLGSPTFLYTGYISFIFLNQRTHFLLGPKMNELEHFKNEK